MKFHADVFAKKENKTEKKKQEESDKKNDHEGGLYKDKSEKIIGKSGGKSSFYKQINLAKCFQKTDGHHMPVKAL